MVKDAKATEDLMPEARALVARLQGEVSEQAVEELLSLEKRARLASDGAATSLLCCAVLKIYHTCQDLDKLCEAAVVLSKKRGQLKRSTADLVHLLMGYLEAKADMMGAPDNQYKLINTLVQITEGKIFLEVERARLRRREASMREGEGDLRRAATLLREEQVEIFISMERREKTEYILEEMRLNLLIADHVRVHIVSRNINPKLLDTEDLQDLKLKYHRYMVEYFLHEKDYLSCATAYKAAYNTPSVQADPAQRGAELSNYLIYVILAALSTERTVELMTIDLNEKQVLEGMPTYRWASYFIHRPLHQALAEHVLVLKSHQLALAPGA